MSNFVYKKAKEAILNGQINFSSNQFKLLFVLDNCIQLFCLYDLFN